MTPLEALNLIYQAAGLARLSRMEHVQVDQATQILKEIIDGADKGVKLGPVAVEDKE